MGSSQTSSALGVRPEFKTPALVACRQCPRLTTNATGRDIGADTRAPQDPHPFVPLNGWGCRSFKQLVGWLDVLIELEQVRRIVLALHLGESCIRFRGIGVSDATLAFVSDKVNVRT